MERFTNILKAIEEKMQRQEQVIYCQQLQIDSLKEKIEKAEHKGEIKC